MGKPSPRKTRTSFDRRCRDAERGLHLPTVNELIRLAPFYNDDIEADIQTFAERMLLAIDKKPEAKAIREALKALSVAPWRDLVDAAIPAFIAAPEHVLKPHRASDTVIRLKLYAAYLGNEDAIIAMANLCFQRSMLNRNASIKIDLLRAGIAWQSCLALRRTGYSFYHLCTPTYVRNQGDEIFKTIGEYWQSTKAAKSGQEDERAAAPSSSATDTLNGKSLVVVSAIGKAGLMHSRDIENEFKPLLNKQLPLRRMSQAAEILRQLAAEFPHATDILDALFREMAEGPYLRLRPTVLLGDPGIGKTRFAQKLMSSLEVPNAIYSCGGVADSSLSGTARQWSTSQPSLPLSLVRQHQIANPCIILDELDKVGTSTHNGNLHDALLGLLEPQSSSRWFDPYLQAPVNLSAVIWMATANTLDGCSGPLRDRVRILRVPAPGPQHLEALTVALLEQISAERGHDARWMPPLTCQELDALRAVWPGGSVRKLRRFLEGVLQARDTTSALQ